MANEKWTVMVLMGANNVSGEADLTKYAHADIDEMTKVGSIPDYMNVVVQLHTKDGGKRFKVIKNGTTDEERLPPLQENSGDPAVLEDFVRRTMGTYPAARYLLIIWGHAWRFAFERDGSQQLDFNKLTTVLHSVNNWNALNHQPGRVNIVAFDSCGVGWIEAVYQLRGTADYLVATQFMDPLSGWPYDAIFQKLADDRTIESLDLARAIVSVVVRAGNYDMMRSLKTSSTVDSQPKSLTLTALDLGAPAEDIGARMADLSAALGIAIGKDPGEIARLSTALAQSAVPIPEPAADLCTLCAALMQTSGSADVRMYAAGVGDLLMNPTRPLIAAHAGTDVSVAMLHGVSIFAPSLKPDFDSASLQPVYEELDLSTETLWDDLMYALPAQL